MNLKEQWSKIPVEWRIEIASAFNTFVATFLATLAMTFSAGGELSFSRDAIAAVVVSALRSAVKAVVNSGFGRNTVKNVHQVPNK